MRLTAFKADFETAPFDRSGIPPSVPRPGAGDATLTIESREPWQDIAPSGLDRYGDGAGAGQCSHLERPLRDLLPDRPRSPVLVAVPRGFLLRIRAIQESA
jgi:hypothetical protein